MTSRRISPEQISHLKPQGNYEVARARAFDLLRCQSDEQLLWLGAVPQENDWQLPVLNEVFQIRLPSREVVASDGQEVDPAWQILVLHYLATSIRPDELPPRITFGDLATARSYSSVYHGRVIRRLCATAGRQQETLRKAAVSVGGRPANGGDAAFQFAVFPRIRVCLIWYAPDDEFPASATLLLPENIESYLCVEDVVVMSERLVARLAGAAC